MWNQAGFGESIMQLDCFGERGASDADFLCQFRNGITTKEIAGPNISRQIAGAWMDESEAVVADEAAVTD